MNGQNEILILTGACGVGKSTIGKLWAQSKKGVCIECDCFTSWIYDGHPITTAYFLEVEPMVARLAWQSTKAYLDNGFSVAIENVWTPKGLRRLKDACDKNDVNAKFVYLTCGLQENKKRDQLRRNDCQMKERVALVRSELEAQNWPDFAHRLDTSGQTSETTLKQIDGLNVLTE
ncbi:MAG: hypothetical protein AAGL34_08355 [Bacteroidota bacterium]